MLVFGGMTVIGRTKFKKPFLAFTQLGFDLGLPYLRGVVLSDRRSK